MTIAGNTQDAFYARPGKVPLPMIVRTKGVYMWDDHGRDYIDASSGPVVSNIGHGNERVADAMARQAKEVDFAYSRVARHQSNLELCRRVSDLAGPGYERVCLASGGSEAMEIAVKFLRQYAISAGFRKKRHVIVLDPSYHGATVATLAATGDFTLDEFLSGFAQVAERIPAPLQYRLPTGHTSRTWRLECAEMLEKRILDLGPENVLAFILEPIGGVATGALPMQEDYMNRVRAICNRHDVWMIYDEVLCGAGRTGQFLASHAWPEARADIVVLAKGLGAGYTPLGAMLAPAQMVDYLAENGGFNYSHTYNANPISCAAGIAVLEEYERFDLMANARTQGNAVRRGLEGLACRHPSIGDIRGKGLLLAIELVSDRIQATPFPLRFSASEKIRVCGLRNGLMIYSRRTSNGKYGEWFMVAPPLTITAAECADLLDRLDATMADFQAEAARFMKSSGPR